MAGVFTAIADQGDIPEEGDINGMITDIDGTILSDVRALVTDVIHSMFSRRVVYLGDKLYTLLKVGSDTVWV